MSTPDEFQPDDGDADDTDADRAPEEDAPNTADWDLTDDEIAAAEVLPVTAERVRGILASQGHQYLLRPNGQPAGVWNGSLFTFTATDRVLQIRGTWSRNISMERRGEFMTIINNIHLRNPWPKCLLQVMDDGTMRLTAEMDTSIVTGLSDQQLTRAIRLGIGSALSIFKQLSDKYPDPLMSGPTAEGTS